MLNLLIIGAGEAGEMVAREIKKHPRAASKYRIVGFLDDGLKGREVAGHPVLGGIEEAPGIIERHGVQEVIVAIPSAGKDTVRRIVASLAPARVATRIVPGLIEIIEGDVSISQVREIEPSDLLGREEIGFDVDRISPHYEGRTVLVTGAGGSIGSEIILQLLELPVKTAVAFGHGENSIHSLMNRVRDKARFRYVIGDIRDREKLARELGRFRPDMLFHAAAHKHVPLMEDYPDEAVKNNVLGTYRCAAAAVEAGVRHFILVSSDKAVNPSSVMGATKRIAERIVLSLNALQETTRFSLTRFGNVLGSRGSVLPIFREQIMGGGPVTVTHPEVTRYFMSIREAARLVVKSATLKAGTIFVLDMGKPVRIMDLAREMIRFCGYTEEEIPIVVTGMRPGEKLHEEVLSQSESLAATVYEKLFMSEENGKLPGRAELDEMVREFEEAAGRCDTAGIRSLIKRYVPEFQGAS